MQPKNIQNNSQNFSYFADSQDLVPPYQYSLFKNFKLFPLAKKMQLTRVAITFQLFLLRRKKTSFFSRKKRKRKIISGRCDTTKKPLRLLFCAGVNPIIFISIILKGQNSCIYFNVHFKVLTCSWLYETVYVLTLSKCLKKYCICKQIGLTI